MCGDGDPPQPINRYLKKKKKRCHGKELRVTKKSSVQPCHYLLQDGENDMIIFKKLFFSLSNLPGGLGGIVG